MAAVDEITGYTDFSQENAQTFATAHYGDGSTKRVEVKIDVEREHRRADGSLVAAGKVASSQDGSVRVSDGAVL